MGTISRIALAVIPIRYAIPYSLCPHPPWASRTLGHAWDRLCLFFARQALICLGLPMALEQYFIASERHAACSCWVAASAVAAATPAAASARAKIVDLIIGHPFLRGAAGP